MDSHHHPSYSRLLKGTSRTVTGALTVTTLPSSIRSSRALWHSSRTSASGIGRHARSWAIALHAKKKRRAKTSESRNRDTHVMEREGGRRRREARGCPSPVEVTHDGGVARVRLQRRKWGGSKMEDGKNERAISRRGSAAVWGALRSSLFRRARGDKEIGNNRPR